MRTASIDARIARFERAVENYSFRGTIPAGESEAAAIAYNQVVVEYDKAKQSLREMCYRLNSKREERQWPVQ